MVENHHQSPQWSPALGCLQPVKMMDEHKNKPHKPTHYSSANACLLIVTLFKCLHAFSIQHRYNTIQSNTMHFMNCTSTYKTVRQCTNMHIRINSTYSTRPYSTHACMQVHTHARPPPPPPTTTPTHI